MIMTDLPGGDLVDAGLADLRAGRAIVAAMLVSIGASRLRKLGIAVPGSAHDSERRLYDMLARDDGDTAHARLDAFVRRLVSFERAAEGVCGVTVYRCRWSRC